MSVPVRPLSKEQEEQFLDAQSAIYPHIGRELIALTPETWTSAVLKLEDEPAGVKHSIYSEDGRREIVVPSMDLFEHTRKLELIFREFGRMWTIAHFRIVQSEEGQWRFNVDFQYPQPQSVAERIVK
jgi:hypothetical protein